jgi:hypothetical protein
LTSHPAAPFGDRDSVVGSTPEEPQAYDPVIVGQTSAGSRTDCAAVQRLRRAAVTPGLGSAVGGARERFGPAMTAGSGALAGRIFAPFTDGSHPAYGPP